MMNVPILSSVQQQLAAVFEQWLTMMREALAATSKRRTPSDSPKGENCKRRPSLPDVERALRTKYHLRYNVLSAAEIYDHLYDLDPRTMRGVCRQNFGAELRSFGVVRRKHHERRVYCVKLINHN